MIESIPPEGASPSPAPSDRGRLLWLALVVFILHLLPTGGHLMSPDEELMYRMAESMALRGTTAIIPLEADIATGRLVPGLPPELAFATRHDPESGEFFAQYLPLQPVLSLPFVYTARLLEGPLAPAFARPLPRTMTTSYLDTLEAGDFARAAFRRGFLVMLFNPLVAALSAVVLARLGRLLTGSRRAGLWAGALWAFTTIAWPHSRTYFTEPLAGLFALLAMDQAIRWAMKPSGEGRPQALLAGAFLALANLTRVDSPLITAGLVISMGVVAGWKFFLEEAYANTRRTFPIGDIVFAGAIAFLAWLGLQYFNKLRFGFDVTSGYGDQSEGVQFTTPLLIGLHGLFCSPGKGMFFFSPGLVLGIAGWYMAPRSHAWIRRFVFFAYLPFFIGMAMWQNWDGGWCWGPRHIVQIHLPIMLGAAFLFSAAMTFPRLVSISLIAAAGIAVQIFATSQNPLDYYREYFQTFEDLEYHRVNYTPLQTADIGRSFRVVEVREDGASGREVHAGAFPAPMIDSLYLPQHSQWMSYGRMWQFGYCDWYLWNAIRDTRGPDRWSKEP